MGGENPVDDFVIIAFRHDDAGFGRSHGQQLLLHRRREGAEDVARAKMNPDRSLGGFRGQGVQVEGGKGDIRLGPLGTVFQCATV